MDIETLKSSIDEFQYWWAALLFFIGVPTTVLLWIKRTRAWLGQRVKWLFSKWPYTIIREQQKEIDKLKGKDLGEEETLILQLSWAIGTDEYINTKRVSDTLLCDSQTAQHILDKLYSQKLLLMHMFFTGTEYSLTKNGRDYIVNNDLAISLGSFNAGMQGRNTARQIMEDYQKIL